MNKKIISWVVAAAMTMSSLAPASSVLAVDTKIEDAFNVVMQDTTVVTGLSTVKVPISFSEDVSFTVANLKFGVQNVPNAGNNHAVIKNIESVLPANSGVTVEIGEKYSGTVNFTSSSGKDYRIKKGEPFAYITLEFQDGDGAQKFDMPAGHVVKVFIDELDIANDKQESFVLSDSAKERSSAYVNVRAEESTDGFGIKVGSEIVYDQKSVKVPVILNGKICSAKTRIDAGEGAVIKNIEKVNEDVTIKGNNILYSVYAYGDDVPELKDEIIAYATVEFTDDIPASSISFRYIDVIDSKAVSVYPAEIDNGMLLNVIKGDVFFEGEPSPVGGTTILLESIENSFDSSVLPTIYEKQAESNPLIKTAIDKFGLDRLAEAGGKACDINDNGVIEGIDSTYLLRYVMEKGFDPDYQWSEILK